MVSSSQDAADSKYQSVLSIPSISESEAVLKRIKRELLSGDKIEAIKIYRKKFGKSLQEAKNIVEAIERETLVTK